MPLSRTKQFSPYTCELMTCEELVFHDTYRVPTQYGTIYGMILGASLGADIIIDPTTGAPKKIDGPVILGEFGVSSYQNKNLRAIAAGIVMDVNNAFPDESCTVILEKGSGSAHTRETVHIFVNAELSLGAADYVSKLFAKRIVQSGDACLARVARRRYHS